MFTTMIMRCSKWILYKMRQSPTRRLMIPCVPRSRCTSPSKTFVCVEGDGSTKIDGKVLEGCPEDVFVIPPWMRYAHTAKKESVLFSISDRPAQEALGIWREGI